MKIILYQCPFVPAEWIFAHGFHPMRIVPSRRIPTGSPLIKEGICSFVTAFINHLCAENSVQGIIITTSCDQMRRAAELIPELFKKPLFLMNVPSTWQTKIPVAIYKNELERLSSFLVRLGGNKTSIQKLSKVMARFEQKRTQLLSQRNQFSPRKFSEALDAFQRLGTVCRPPPPPFIQKKGIPVALVGGSMLSAYYPIFDLIESFGGFVTLDATSTGERTLPAPFDSEKVADDPFSALVLGYFGNIPEIFQRPNSRLYDYLAGKISERGIRGIILLRHLWCDKWHAEVHRMKQFFDLPLIDIEYTEGENLPVRTITHIQSFMEMLR